MRRTILLTGATGMVGSQLLPTLVESGYEVVCLVRDTPQWRAAARLDVRPCAGRVTVLSGDVTIPYCGLSEREVHCWRGRIDLVIHSATLAKFDEHLAAEINAANVGGTRNVLALAEALEVPAFHYVSTAYVAGGAARLSEFEEGRAEDARNPYERAKQASEALVRARTGSAHAIHRLSVVIGDSRTGYTSGFDGYYGYFAPFWALRDRFQAFPDDAVLYARAHPETTMNLVPIDWVVSMLLRLLEVPLSGQTYHLTHPTPPRLAWLMDVSFDALRVPVVTVPLDDVRVPYPDARVQQLQRMIHRGEKRYVPYISHEASFLTHNIRRALGRRYEAPPPIDERLIREVILPYAMDTEFGRTEKAAVATAC